MENDTNQWVFYVDDGGGMNTDGIRKCMSLGYSSKKANTTIGQCNYNKLHPQWGMCYFIVTMS